MIFKFIKSLFQKTIVDEGQKHEGKEHKIHKSLNAATLLVNIMLEQNNVSVNTDNSSNMDTNNNNQHNQKNK